MKKSFAILSLIISLVVSMPASAQTLIAKWTFPSGNPTDSLADGGLPANLTKAIRTEGGTSAIDFSKNGFTTKAAQATGWDNGAQTKSWVVEITTVNYDHLKISSKQQSGGNNPGPRDFTLQYRIAVNGTWTDVPDAVIVTANNWTSGALDSVALPDSCANRPSLFLRWLMTSDTNSAGAIVASTGIDKIDEIYISGKQISTGLDETFGSAECRIYPNPSHGNLTIASSEPVVEISLINQLGIAVHKQTTPASRKIVFNPENLPGGIYVIKVQLQSEKLITKKVILY
jgi:hypothetical protein